MMEGLTATGGQGLVWRIGKGCARLGGGRGSRWQPLRVRKEAENRKEKREGIKGKRGRELSREGEKKRTRKKR